MIELIADFYKVFIPLFLIVMIPVLVAVCCFVIDTLISLKYYLWNKEDRSNSEDENASD